MAGLRFIMKTILGSVLINQSGNFCLYLKSFRIIRAKEKTWYFKLRFEFVAHVFYFCIYFLCNFNHSLFFCCTLYLIMHQTIKYMDEHVQLYSFFTSTLDGSERSTLPSTNPL